MEFLWFILIGAAAGWLAGTLMKTGSSSLVRNIIVGVIGAVLGGWLAGVLGISIGGGLLGAILVATGGACLLLFLITKFT